MTVAPPRPAADATAAEWLAARLGGEFGAVSRTIPTGFAAYARILHPADPGGTTPRRWSEVAAANGTTLHALAQYGRISRSAVADAAGPLADVQPPMLGALEPDSLRALCDVLAVHSATAAQCWFAVWDGWGELNGPGVSVTFRRIGSTPSPPPRPAPAHWQLDLGAPTFTLPGRTYYLFGGRLDEVTRIGHWATENWFRPLPPNLFWPDDRSWCVASEIDFDSTLVGGSGALIADVLAHPALEVWPIAPHDSLAEDGDGVNP